MKPRELIGLMKSAIKNRFSFTKEEIGRGAEF